MQKNILNFLKKKNFFFGFEILKMFQMGFFLIKKLKCTKKEGNTNVSQEQDEMWSNERIHKIEA